MKRIKIIHKEPNEECLEVLKSVIVEDETIKQYRIDKDTLLDNLPEKVVNEFLDFIGRQGQFRELTLRMIKNGTLSLICEEYV